MTPINEREELSQVILEDKVVRECLKHGMVPPALLALDHDMGHYVILYCPHSGCGASFQSIYLECKKEDVGWDTVSTWMPPGFEVSA